MHLDQLIQRHFQLRQELTIAYKATPWQTGRIDRLADEIARTESQIVASRRIAPSPNLPESRPAF